MIRPLDPATDLAAIAAIEAESFDPAWDEPMFRSRLTRPGAGGLVAEVGGRVVGFLIHEPSGVGTYVADLAVVPHSRGQGLGRHLLRRMLDAGSPLALHVSTTNAVAGGLYLSLGFHQVRIDPDFYGAGEGAALMIHS